MLAVYAALIGTPCPAAAGDPRLIWMTIETQHFVIHYYEPLGEVARRVALVAEHSHTLLTPVLGHTPKDKTQVVITDDVDGANGFARVVPRNHITLFATAPTSLSQLNDYDDWLYLLFAHEYTHVLHLDSIDGLPKWVNKVVGKTWAPNQVQPRWMIEGIATYQESKQSSAGRLRNAMFHMELRAAVLADKSLRLDQITNGPRAWPRGNAFYLYGSHFLAYIFDRYGMDKLRELSWAYGSNPIPYSLNRSIAQVAGQTFDTLYNEWLQHLRDTYSMQLEAIQRAGIREGRRLTFSAETNRSPVYTPDGKHIIWLQSDGYSEGRLLAMPVGGNVGRAFDYGDIERLGEYDAMSDGSLVIEQNTTWRTNYSYQDLYIWRRQNDTYERLTHGLRARDPALSPDERQVAFVINNQSQASVAVMPLVPGAEHRILWKGGRFDQAGAPAWSPDGRHVAFTAWTEGGYRDIYMVDMESGETERITHDRAIDADPIFSPDGAYLYYVSDRSGIYNVYALDRQTGEVWQVTNVIGGALSPDVSPDGTRLVYQSFTVGGYELYEIMLNKDFWIEPLPYINSRPDPVRIPEQGVLISKPRPYRPLETLAPQSYTVGLQTDSFGQSLLIETSGSDSVGLHAYGLSATVSLERGDISVGGSYAYSRLWPSLRISAGRSVSQRGGVFIDGRNTAYIYDSYSATLSMGFPVLRTDRASSQLSLDYDIDWLRNSGDEYEQPDPNDTLPRFPEVDTTLAGIALRWSYSDRRGYTYSIGPAAGKGLGASLRINHPGLGSDFRALQLSYNGEWFRKLPWGDTPVLVVRLTGGLNVSDQRRTPGFVLGGVPEQNIVDSLINNVRFGFTGYLRGYERGSISGTQYHLANIEYRQHLFELERGLSTLPVYVRRLHVGGLLDIGDAFNDEINWRELKVGLGAALRLDTIVGYFIPGSFEIGYSRGLTNGGIGQYWLLLTATI